MQFVPALSVQTESEDNLDEVIISLKDIHVILCQITAH